MRKRQPTPTCLPVPAAPGKTTCARILAKTVNCEHRTPEGNPCLECDICREAERGALSDIVEIDAASNNSVEDIRDLREGTVYLPERCRYKVYIIDEVHMLSPSAWGALLKVMEEPPEYVKFILATTEVHKVPATIISRCQRYDFHRIRTADIAARLEYIAGEEQLSLEPEAAQLIAHLSDGGMRDALSLLDQCASGGEAITAASVTAAAGVAGRDSVFAILEAVQAQDAAKALEYTGALYDQSKDMVRLCDELLEQLRNMMLLKAGTGQPGSADLSAGRAAAAGTAGTEALAGYDPVADRPAARLSGTHAAKSEQACGTGNAVVAAGSAQGRCTGFAGSDSGSPAGTACPAACCGTPDHTVCTAAEPAAAEPEQKPLTAAEIQPVNNWADILAAYQAVNPAVSGSLAESSAYIAGNNLLIVAKNRFFLTLLKNKENALSLRETVKQVLGAEYNIVPSAASRRNRPPRHRICCKRQWTVIWIRQWKNDRSLPDRLA